MRLKQKTKNIIAGILATVFAFTLTTTYIVFIYRHHIFKIDEIIIDDDKQYLLGILNRDFNIDKGKSIFGFNATDTSERIKELIPSIRDIKITKTLPSTVSISVSHRTPALRLSRNQFYVVDVSGKIYMASKSNTTIDVFKATPILIDNDAELLRPGDELHPEAKRSLEFINKFNSVVINPQFKITEIDTSNDIYIILNTDNNRSIFIAWEEIKNDQQIISAINLATNAMNDKENDAHQKIYVLVNSNRCHFL